MSSMGMVDRPKVGDEVAIRYTTDSRRAIDQGPGKVIDMDRRKDQVLVRWTDSAYGPAETWEDVEDLEVMQ